MKLKKMAFILSGMMLYGISVMADDALKGIWSDVKKFPPFHSSFWQSFGQGFGASPSGYVYSFSVYNDLRTPIYFAINEIISFMGGNFPKPQGWHLYTIPSFQHQVVHDQSYYFELLIKSTPEGYASRMPYLQHEDILHRFEGIQISGQQHSTKMHFYRSYMGKIIQNGVITHQPAAEYLGYNDPSGTSKGVGGVSIGSTLQSITIYNSTDQDYMLSFSRPSESKSISSLVYAMVPAHSFAMLQSCFLFSSITGVINIFDVQTKNLVASYALPSKIFKNMPYTLEIYQDQGSKSDTIVQMDLQGLMSGNYDQVVGAIRDITPVTCIFWYDTAKIITNNLPGKLWIIRVTDQLESEIVGGVASGQSVQFNCIRPMPNEKLLLYFVYVDTADDQKAKQFLADCAKKSFFKMVANQYWQQSEEQKNAVCSLVDQRIAKKIPKSLLEQAAQGLLSLHGGKMYDEQLDISGYLLGADVFASFGVGAGPMYYYLAANDKTESIFPINTVQNLYASSAGSVKAPSGMPTPTIIG